MSALDDYVCLVVHAEAKVGKTFFGCTGPGTTLVLDSEAGGMRFVPGKKVTWDVDAGEPCPEPGDWRICQVPVSGMMTYSRVRDVLLGDHPFNNISIDSLTESQDMLKREIDPMFQIDQQGWGRVFGMSNDMVVTFRDIVARDPRLKSLVVVTGTQFKDGRYRPMLSGQFARKVGYKLDAIAYLTKVVDEDGDARRLLILDDPTNQYEVGNRLGPDAPSILWDPTITRLLNAVFKTDYEEVV